MVTLSGLVRTDGEKVYEDDVFIDGDIDGRSAVNIRTTNGNIIVKGKIDGQSKVVLEATKGFVTIGDKIDGQCNVALKSGTGICIGGKIDGQCKVKLSAKSGQIVVMGKIDGGSGTVVHHHGVSRVDVLDGVRGNMIVGYSVCIDKDWEAEEAK